MGTGVGAYDLIVVGGGMGGLATAALARRAGLRVALLEAHTTLGGCAGYFGRGSYTFDAGATALMGLGAGEPVGDLLRVVGVAFLAETARSYRVLLPDRTLDIVPDAAVFERASAAAFPRNVRAQRDFWRLQAAVGSSLLRSAGRVPRLPVRTAGDLVYDLRILGPAGVLAASSWAVTVRDVLRLLGLDGDIPFRSLVAMLLQDTAQAGPETVPFANAAACLQAYRLGMSRPRGGMRALVEGLGGRFAALGGDLRMATKVDRVVPIGGGGFEVVTRRRDRLAARQVALNLPLDLAAALLGRTLEGRLGRRSGARGPPGVPSPATSRSTARRSPTTPRCSTMSSRITTGRSTTATTCSSRSRPRATTATARRGPRRDAVDAHRARRLGRARPRLLRREEGRVSRSVARGPGPRPARRDGPLGP